MSQEKKKGQEESVNNQSVVEPELEIPSEEPENQEKGQSKTDSADETDNLAAEVEELKKKIEKLNHEVLLARADFDNYRKRTLREKAELLKNGGEDCMKHILPIIDDFERGLLSISETSDVEAVKEGMNLIYSKFKTYLEQHGVKEIKTDKQDFDTEYHEAVTTFPVEDASLKGKIIDCVQKGYTLNDKVIRYAKVVVGE
ncbi:MAG TPA: nucleotide exchange factor GrpE [Candidatus Gallibacteroides avistercoris]|uniref:Protein GrpE n=1 Tax=Candidatus Gallibacteroides avistercoris TaxID=2840833 RepID=A0A9D1M7D9_9BACT|nr:nucleotide exchange factor GrpE [Candidatus Gallibacteroides avistercoris]